MTTVPPDKFQAQKEKVIGEMRERVTRLQKTRGNPAIGSSIDFTHQVIVVLDGMLSLIELQEMEKNYEKQNKQA